MSLIEEQFISACKEFVAGDRQFRTKIGKAPLAVYYSKHILPVEVQVWVPMQDTVDHTLSWTLGRLRQTCFTREFFNHLRRAERDNRNPPMLINFNCIHASECAFKLKPNLGKTIGKFARFFNPIDGHSYLASNSLSSDELLRHMDANGCGYQFYSTDTSTPVPTFDAFSRILKFLNVKKSAHGSKDEVMI